MEPLIIITTFGFMLGFGLLAHWWGAAGKRWSMEALETGVAPATRWFGLRVYASASPKWFYQFYLFISNINILMEWALIGMSFIYAVLVVALVIFSAYLAS